MRSILIVLLAFATGVLLTLTIDSTASRRMAGNTDVSAPSGMFSRGGNPVATSSTDDSANADPGSTWPNDGPSPEQVLYAQPRMVRDALAKLTPRVPGIPNLYVLALAGDGSENVFHNEVEYAGQLFTKRFGATTHSVILENNPTSLSTRPLASWSNLEATLDGLAKVMQPEQDILLLYITTHGDEDHNLLIDMDPLPLDQIGSADLADILNKRAFKWKVVVVNACYSGGFVPPLRSPGTLILTSARSDRSSFGCGSDSDITYFGKAWLVDALNHTDNFATAFQRANTDITAWEAQDKLAPSEPQINMGSGIGNQLALWRKGFKPGPVIPFRPHAPTTVSNPGPTTH